MIARHLLIACVIYLTLVLQPSLVHGLGYASFRPWLPALAIVAIAAWITPASSLVWAGILGLGIDSLSGERLGIHLIAATLLTLGLGAIRSNLGSRPLITVVSVFFATFSWRYGIAVTIARQTGRVLNLESLATQAACDGLSTILLAFVLLLVFRLLSTSIKSSPTSSVSLSNRWSMLTGS